MQNPIKHGVIALAVSAFLMQGALAQTQKGGPVLGGSQVQAPVPGSSPNTQVTRLETALYLTLISIDFGGGTVAEYIDTVKDAALKAQVDVNVICPSEARDVKVSPISLKSVTLGTAMEALCATFAGSNEYRFDVTTVGSSSSSKIGNESPTFGLRFESSRGARSQTGTSGAKMQITPGADQTSIDVLAVQDLLEVPPGMAANDSTRTTKETLLQAVNAAFSLQHEAKPPEILFHPETGLLIVRGTNEQNMLASTVVNRIRDGLTQRRAQMSRPMDSAASRARRVAGMSARMEVAKAEFDEARSSLERCMKMREQGTVPEEVLSKTRLDVVRSEGKFKEAIADLEQAKAEASEAGVSDPGLSSVPAEAMIVTIYDVQDLHAPLDQLVKLATMLAGPGAKVESLQGANGPQIIVKDQKARQADVRMLFDTIRASKSDGAKPEGAKPAPNRNAK